MKPYVAFLLAISLIGCAQSVPQDHPTTQLYYEGRACKGDDCREAINAAGYPETLPHLQSRVDPLEKSANKPKKYKAAVKPCRTADISFNGRTEEVFKCVNGKMEQQLTGAGGADPCDGLACTPHDADKIKPPHCEPSIDGNSVVCVNWQKAKPVVIDCDAISDIARISCLMNQIAPAAPDEAEAVGKSIQVFRDTPVATYDTVTHIITITAGKVVITITPRDK